MNDYKMTPGELRATWGLGTVFSLRMLGMFMVLPVLTTYGMALQGASEALIGLAIGIYGLAQAIFQIPFGLLSDRIGRKPLIVGGMWLCGIGVLLLVLTHTVWLWTLEAGLIGFGMAMLYPTLGAAVADVSPPAQRSTLLGVYRFWRDFGYAVGALSMGLLAQWTQGLDVTFWLVGVAMLLSGAWVALTFNKE